MQNNLQGTIFPLIWFGLGLVLYIAAIVLGLKRQKRLRAINAEFDRTASRVIGKVYKSKVKLSHYSDDRSTASKKHEVYAHVIYEYYVDGVRYTTKYTHNLDKYKLHKDAQHEFLYDPNYPEKAYWSAGDYKPDQKERVAAACLRLCCGSQFLFWQIKLPVCGYKSVRADPKIKRELMDTG